MATVNIGGRRVKVDNSFLSLSPGDQQKTVDEIEASLGGAAAPTAPAAPVADMSAPVYASPQADQPLRDAPPRPNVPLAVQSTGAGAAELAGMLPDLASGLFNVPIAAYNLGAGVVGAPQTNFKFPAFSDVLKNRATTVAEDAGYNVRDPKDLPWEQQLPYNINRFGVQAAGMVPALARAGAKRLADVVAGDIAPRWFDPLVRPYTGAQPGKTVALDAAGAGGSGAGVTAADQLAPDNPVTSYLGALGGGVAGSTLGQAVMAVPRLMTNVARSAFGLTKDPQIPLDPNVPFAQQQAYPRSVANKATEIFQNEATNAPAAQTRMVQSQSEIAPYMTATPTAGQLSEDTGLLLLEKELRARNQAPYNEQTRALNTAARDTVEGVVPPGADRQDLIGAAQTEATGQRAAAQAGVENVQARQQRVENIRQGQAQDYTPAANPPVPPSQALHTEVVEQSLRPMTAERNVRYEAIPNTPAPTQAIVDRANDLEFQLSQLPQGFRERVDPGGVLQGLRNLVDDQGNAVDVGLQTLQRMRNQLGEAEKAARNNPSNRSPLLADNIRDLRQSIATLVDQHPDAAEATRYTRETFSPVWGDTSPTARSFRRQFWADPDTSSKAPPSETASRFLQPGAPEKTAELQRIIGSMADPAQAQNAARDYLRADLAASGAVDAQGRLNPRAVETWANKNQANLDLVPGFRNEIEGVVDRARRGVQVSERLTGDLRGAQAAQQLTETQINKGALGAVLNSDPDKAVARVMSDPYSSGGKLDELIRLTANDPKARAGLKQAVQDFILDKATTTATEKMKAGDPRTPVSYAKLSQIFDEHAPQLSQIYDPAEMNALRAVQKSLGLAKGGLMSGAGSTEAVTRLHQNVVEQFRGTPLGRGLEAFARLKFGALTAGGKLAGIRRALHGVGADEAAQIEQLLVRASLDPDVAKILLGREIAVGSPKWNKSLSKLLGAGEAARDISKPEEE